MHGVGNGSSLGLILKPHSAFDRYSDESLERISQIGIH